MQNYERRTKEDLITGFLKRTPLEIRMRNLLEMSDIKNWQEGEYLGDMDFMLKVILEEVDGWQQDGASIYSEHKND